MSENQNPPATASRPVPIFRDVRLLMQGQRMSFYSEFGIPHWGDFAPTSKRQSRVVRRPDIVRGILRATRRDRLHLLVGASASGKTTLVKEIAATWLRNPRHSAYYADATDLQSLAKTGATDIEDDFWRVDTGDQQALFLIDNAHIAFNEIGGLLRRAETRGWSGFLILTLVPDLPRYYAMLDDNPLASALGVERFVTRVSSGDIAAELINKFGEPLNTDRSTDEIAHILDLCGHNLHRLRFYLLGHAAKANLATTGSASNFMESYLTVRLDKARARHGDEGILCLAATAVWSALDVFLERHFLINSGARGGLAVSASVVDGLVRDGELQESWGALRIPHRAVALAYLDTIENTPALDVLVREEIAIRCGVRGNLRETMIHLYLKHRPHAIDVISKHLCNRSDVAAAIASRPETIDAVFETMLEQSDLRRISETFINFEWNNSRLSRELMTRVIKASDRILPLLYRQTSILPIVQFLSPMWYVSSDSVTRGVRVYTDAGTEKGEPHLTDVECPYIVPFVTLNDYRVDVAAKLQNGGVVRTTASPQTEYAAEQRLLNNTSICIKAFVYSQHVLCSKLTVADQRPGGVILRALDAGFIGRLLEQEFTLRNFIYAVSVIAYFDRQLAKDLLATLDFGRLESRVRKERDMPVLSYSLFLLSSLVPRIAMAINRELDEERRLAVQAYGWPSGRV